MDDIELRLDRAERNVRGLNDEVRGFLDPKANIHTSVVEIHPNGDGVVSVKVTENPPSHWGLMIGDVLTDLRFALDYIAYRAVTRFTKQDPPPDPEGIEFPIYLHKAWFEELDPKTSQPKRRSGLYKVSRMSAKAGRFIQDIQPYGSGNGGDTSWLWYLNVLCNVNKHRFIPVTVAFLNVHTLAFETQFATISQVKAMKTDDLQDGTVIATLHVDSLAGGTPRVQIKSQLTRDIIFKPGSPTHGQPLIGTLDALLFHVRWVYGELLAEI